MPAARWNASTAPSTRAATVWAPREERQQASIVRQKWRSWRGYPAKANSSGSAAVSYPVVLGELLRRAGWMPETTGQLDSAVVLPNALPMWDQMANGGTTYASLVADLTPDHQHAVRERFNQRCETHRRPDGLQLPSGLRLVVATR